MKTREQVTVTGDFKIATWSAGDGQEACWSSLRAQAGGIAGRRGLALDDGEADGRHILFMRVLARNGFDAMSSECPAGEAEFVRLRLECWAAGK